MNMYVQTPEELDFLVGGRIVEIVNKEDDFGEGVLELVITVRSDVDLVDQDGKQYKKVRIQVWCDEEGNGPGHLAFVG